MPLFYHNQNAKLRESNQYSEHDIKLSCRMKKCCLCLRNGCSFVSSKCEAELACKGGARLMDLPHDGSESRELDMFPIFELPLVKMKVEEGHRFTTEHVESMEGEMCLVE
jgi:hypothetical protein